MIISFSSFGFLVLEWGQQFYVIKALAPHPERTGVLLGTTLLLRVIGTALAVIPFGIAARLLGYDDTTCWYIVAIFAVTLPFFLTQGYSIIFRSRERMDLDALLSVVNRASILGFAVVALALGGRLPSVLTAQAIAGAVALLLAILLYRNVVSMPLSFSTESAREVFVAGAMLLPYVVVGNVQPNIDAVILAKLTPAEVVGWYGASKSISGALFAPALILGTAIYPRLARVAADARAIEAHSQPALRPFLWLGALAATGTLLFAEDAIALVYGLAQFAPSAMVLKFYAPVLFLLFINVLFGYILVARGRVAQSTMLQLVSVVIATTLELILIPYFQESMRNGGLGVAVAFITSELVVLAGGLYLLRQDGIRLKTSIDMGRALAVAGMTIFVFWWLPPLPLLVRLPLCVGLFAIGSFGLGLVRRDDLDFFIALLRKEKVE